MADTSHSPRHRGIGFAAAVGLLALAVTSAAFDAPAAGGPTSRPVEGRIDGWFAKRKAGVEPPKLPEKITTAFVIPIDGPITDTLYEVLKYKVTTCRGKGAELIIFDMDTPGGSVSAMDKIIKLITEDLKDIYTLAYVNPDAYSAGALISLACNSIAMAPRGVIGDAMPILITPNGGLAPLPKEERAKIESPIRVKVRKLAEDRGYIPVVCEAMVTASMELWVIRNEVTRELRIVDADHWEKKQKATPTPEWKYVETFDPDDLLVTLETQKAVFCGIARHALEDMEALQKQFNITAAPERLEDTSLDKVAHFLTSPAVSGLLATIMMIAIYMEFKTPGVGIYAAVAVLCLLTLIASRFLVGLANPVEVGILALGVVLLVLEIFVIPGFGVAGISGIILIIAALLAMWIPNAPSELPVPKIQADWDMLGNGVLTLLGSFIAASIAAAVLARYLPKVPVASRLILAPGVAVAAPAGDEAPIAAVSVGDVGTVRSMCRPVGQVLFDDSLVDAMAEGEAIPAGTKVRVVKKEGNRVVVTREDTDLTPPAGEGE